MFSGMMDRCGDETADVFEALNSPDLLSLRFRSGAPFALQLGF